MCYLHVSILSIQTSDIIQELSTYPSIVQHVLSIYPVHTNTWYNTRVIYLPVHPPTCVILSIDTNTWYNDVTAFGWKSVIHICSNKEAGVFSQIACCFNKLVIAKMLIKTTHYCTNLESMCVKSDSTRVKLC